MVWKWMDGRIWKEDVVKRGRQCVTRRESGASDGDTGNTCSSMGGESSQSNLSGGFDGFSQKSRDERREEQDSPGSDLRISLGRGIGGLGGTPPFGWDPLYLHAAPLPLFTHVVHGSLASHFLRTE